MTLLGLTVVLGLLAGGRAAILLPNELRPACDSPEAEAAALAAQDFINTQHNHGYKYALNRIEDIKILRQPGADDLYIMEVDLLETNCHIQDPTPLANCTVRPKVLTAVEGDCDVVLKNVGGTMAVQAFKCKTEESTEDLCLGCATLLPLNDTIGLDFVKASMVTLNNNTVAGASFAVAEVGRMSSQVVSGGPMYAAEFLIVEANCTGDDCVPSHDAMAQRGFCTAKGLNFGHAVDCKMFPNLIPVMDANNTVAHASPAGPVFPVHTATLSAKHGLRHHKLTLLHNPAQTLLLSVSGESPESSEVVPVATAVNVAPVVPVAPAVAAAADPAPAAADPALAAADPALAAADPAPAAADPAPAAAADPAPAAAADPTPAAAADPTPAAAADPGAAAAAEAAPADDSSASESMSKSMEAPVVMVKREAPLADAAMDIPAVMPAVPINLVPLCPGRIRYFD